MKRRLLSMLLTLTMVISLVPGMTVTASAAEGGEQRSINLSDLEAGMVLPVGTVINNDVWGIVCVDDYQTYLWEMAGLDYSNKTETQQYYTGICSTLGIEGYGDFYQSSSNTNSIELAGSLAISSGSSISTTQGWLCYKTATSGGRLWAYFVSPDVLGGANSALKFDRNPYSVEKGGTVALSADFATGTAPNGDYDVVYSLIGTYAEGTSVNAETGLLTAAAGETAATITVQAMVKAGSTYVTNVAVTVSGNGTGSEQPGEGGNESSLVAVPEASGFNTDANGTMAYAFNDTKDTFDIIGKFEDQWLATTWNKSGYETYLMEENREAEKVLVSGADGIKNWTNSTRKLQVSVEMAFTNAGKTLQINYAVKNVSNEEINFSLGSGADVKINTDDYALITPFENGGGFKMVSAEDNAQFNFFGTDYYDGVTSVSDFWYGACDLGDNENYYWVDNEGNAVFYGEEECLSGEAFEEESGDPLDSAVSWHWDGRIGAGETKYYSVLIGVGGANSENAAAPADGHFHCACVDSDICDEVSHNAATEWEAWDSTTSLPINAGYYYLTKNVAISSDWTPARGTFLCLNGKVVTLNNGSSIYVDKGTFTLTDCDTTTPHYFTVDSNGLWTLTNTETENSVTGGVITGSSVNAVEVQTASSTMGSFTMYGGNIVGNGAPDFYRGGGIYVYGTQATIYGGSIRGNVAQNGAGICALTPNASIRLYGGAISDNTATVQGGGIFSAAGIEVMGAPVVNGNWKTASSAPMPSSASESASEPVENNVEIVISQASALEEPTNNISLIELSGKLTEDAEIGMTIATSDFFTRYWGYIMESEDDPADYFFSDNPDYTVVREIYDPEGTGEGVFELRLAEGGEQPGPGGEQPGPGGDPLGDPENLHAIYISLDKAQSFDTLVDGQAPVPPASNLFSVEIQTEESYNDVEESVTAEWVYVALADVEDLMAGENVFQPAGNSHVVSQYSESNPQGANYYFIKATITANRNFDENDAIGNMMDLQEADLVYISQNGSYNGGQEVNYIPCRLDIQDNTITVYFMVAVEQGGGGGGPGGDEPSVITSVGVTIDYSKIPEIKEGDLIGDFLYYTEENPYSGPLQIDNENAYVLQSGWWMYNEEANRWTPPGERFEKDKIYGYAFCLTPKTGYVFEATDSILSESTGKNDKIDWLYPAEPYDLSFCFLLGTLEDIEDEREEAINPTPTPPASRPSSGGSYTPPTVNVPVSNDENKVDVKAEVSGKDATIKPLDNKQIEQLVGDKGASGDVVVDLSKLGKDIDTAGIPKKTLEAIVDAAEDAGNDTEHLVIKLTTAELKLDDAAMRAIVDQSKGDIIKFNFDDVGTERLNYKQKEAVKDMDIRKGYEAYITVNGQRVSDFKGGNVEITVPYEVPAGEAVAGFSVWYIDENGKAEKQKSSYDGKNKWFVVSHFSDYVIVYNEDDASVTNCPKDATCPIDPFTDTKNRAWYHNGVHYCVENGLMVGNGSDLFEPNGITTRAQIVTILWRMEGSPVVEDAKDFDDVTAKKWYYNAVRWASANEIVEGYDNGLFAPNDSITREQLAAILYRYCQYKGIDVSVGEETNILSYEDAIGIRKWAIPGLQWACGSGLIQGIEKNGTMYLDPRGSAVRSQSATIIYRLCTEIGK